MKFRLKEQNLKIKGFTIIELMIATVVFAMALVILTIGFITISRTYYKGVTTNQTQNATRNITSALTQALEFDGKFTWLGFGVDGQTLNFCIGNQLFSFLPGYQLTQTYSASNFTTQFSFLEGNGDCDAGPQSLANAIGPNRALNMIELMGQKMRLASDKSIKKIISQDPSSGLYTVDVRIVYGDNDLLCNNIAKPGSCSGSLQLTLPTDFIGNVQCKGQAGGQFCATSELTSTVAGRIE